MRTKRSEDAIINEYEKWFSKRDRLRDDELTSGAIDSLKQNYPPINNYKNADQVIMASHSTVGDNAVKGSPNNVDVDYAKIYAENAFDAPRGISSYQRSQLPIQAEPEFYEETNVAIKEESTIAKVLETLFNFLTRIHI